MASSSRKETYISDESKKIRNGDTFRDSEARIGLEEYGYCGYAEEDTGEGYHHGCLVLRINEVRLSAIRRSEGRVIEEVYETHCAVFLG